MSVEMMTAEEVKARFPKGSRVQLHPATDDWMRGDRYGVVVGYGRAREYVGPSNTRYKMRPVLVKLDKSGKTKRHNAHNLLSVDRDEDDKALRRNSSKRNPDGRLVDAIGPGDRVTIVDRFGKERSGKAVMRSSNGGWVLNMGGKYGTPGIADDSNVVRVSKSKKKPSGAAYFVAGRAPNPDPPCPHCGAFAQRCASDVPRRRATVCMMTGKVLKKWDRKNVKRKRNPVNAHNLAHFAKWNLGGTHKWITKAIAGKLPPLRTHAETPAEKVPVPLKLFNPGGAGSWFITEADLETGEAFGYVTGLGGDELGYIDLNELRSFRGRMGLPIERDEYFSGTLAEVMEGKKNPRKRGIIPLKREAAQAMITRGHKVGHWHSGTRYGHTVKDAAWTACEYCGLTAFVDAHPPPNGIEISGEAVALNCKDARSKLNQAFQDGGSASKFDSAGNLKKNPRSKAFVIALYMGGPKGKRLTFSSSKLRFTDDKKPALYATQNGAADRARELIAKHSHLKKYRITVEQATQAERGEVFGARPVLGNPKLRKYIVRLWNEDGYSYLLDGGGTSDDVSEAAVFGKKSAEKAAARLRTTPLGKTGRVTVENRPPKR